MVLRMSSPRPDSGLKLLASSRVFVALSLNSTCKHARWGGEGKGGRGGQVDRTTIAYRAMAVGLKVHADSKLNGLVVQVLDS